MRVLAFAAEAWESKLLLGILQDRETFASADARRLVMSDVTTLQYDRDFLDWLRSTPNIEVTSLESIFESWQLPSEVPSSTGETLKQWASRHNSRFSTATLLSSDIILTPWERSSWHLPTSAAWRERIAADQVAFAEEQIADFRPDVILCVERRRLVGLAAQVVAEAKGLTALTLVFSRVGSRWMVRSDGGIGMSASEYARFTSHRPSERTVDTVREITRSIRAGGPLYDSLARPRERNHGLRRKSGLVSAMAEFKRVARAIAIRHLHPRGGSRAQHFPAVRYEQDFRGLTKAQLRQVGVRICAALEIGSRALGDLSSIDARIPYVLWMLHTRPEDGVSAMGRGLDELEVLLELRRLLPAEIGLVVKENPSMLGTRLPSFYARIGQAGITLLGPRVDSATLLASASGVAGLSGTVLLEGLISGKPTLILGEPEFLGCTSFQAWSAVKQFSECVLSGEIPDADVHNAERYLAWVLENSDERDLFWGDLDSEDGDRMVQSAAKRFFSLTRHDA